MICAAALAIGPLLGAGCGSQAAESKRVDPAQAEAAVRQLVLRSHGKPLRSIRCPGRIVARRGATFQCRLVAANGSTATITEHVEDNSGHVAVGLLDLHVTSAPSGIALGTPVRIRSVPQQGPREALVLSVGRPIDPDVAGDGASEGSFSAGEVWPSTADQAGGGRTIHVRFVDLPVRVANTGRVPVRVMITGGASDQQGREAAAVLRSGQTWPWPHGRQPDWTSRQGSPIAPGARMTRYITFPVETGSRVTQISLSPTALHRGLVLTMLPDVVTFRGP